VDSAFMDLLLGLITGAVIMALSIKSRISTPQGDL
jgi:hypothetical protein